MGIILSLITVVAGMNIVGTLILMVLTRNREISILRAMGASAGQIRMVCWEAAGRHEGSDLNQLPESMRECWKKQEAQARERRPRGTHGRRV